jgi:hypothetical protein
MVRGSIPRRPTALNEAGEIVGWQRFPDRRAAAWFLEHGDPTQWGRATRTALDQGARGDHERRLRRRRHSADLLQLVGELAEQRKQRLASGERRREQKRLDPTAE